MEAPGAAQHEIRRYETRRYDMVHDGVRNRTQHGIECASRTAAGVRLAAAVALVLLFLASCTTLRVPSDIATGYSLAPPETGLIRELAAETARARERSGADSGVPRIPVVLRRGDSETVTVDAPTPVDPPTPAALPLPSDTADGSLLLIPGNRDALLWRLALTDSAETSLDVQTFLWELDDSGILLLERLLQAADRGVRVRVLVDDIFNTKPDRTVAALSTHPNLEVRVFNPNPARRTTAGSAVRFMLELQRLNRRMHNKLFIADGKAAILGGRNIGDKYFGLHAGYNFLDLDVLVTGDALEAMSASFDEYWNSPYAIPGSSFSRRGTALHLHSIRESSVDLITRSEVLRDPQLFPASWQPFFQSAVPNMIPAQLRYVYDSATEHADRRVVPTLKDMALTEAGDVIIVTPYFLPGSGTLARLTDLRAEGNRVRLIVPSLGSINHTAVHSHYRKYRRDLLQSGIELFEYHYDPSGPGRDHADTAPVAARFISMHMKAVVAGDSTAYVGSLNFDHRALRINTENGLIVSSPEFARQLRGMLEAMMEPEESWQVREAERGYEWVSEDETRRRPPARSGFQRISEFFYRLLPIENQL